MTLSGRKVILSRPNLAKSETDPGKVEACELCRFDTVQARLEAVFAEKNTESGPDTANALTSFLKSWSGVTGIFNADNNTTDNNTSVAVGDRLALGSITKPVTATTLLRLVDAGMLALDDTLTTWLPESVTATLPNAESIMLRQLLNHSSGVAEYDAILLERGMANPTIFLKDWLPEDIVELVNDLEPFFEPGEGWQYSSTNFILASMVIEAAMGNDLASEIRIHVVDPLGLDNTFFALGEEIYDGNIRNISTDSIGIVEDEFTFADDTLTQDGANTVLGISSTGETLAILNNVQASALGESDFVTVPDVSNIDDALALI
ncbi:MAG: serine hydrolase domain-containing protein [Cyanobacteria bacterium P01_F01_bin.86]